MDFETYSIRLGMDDRNALARVATAWSVKRSDAIRLAIRALAEALDAQQRAVAMPTGPRPDDMPDGQEAADDH